MIPPAHRTLAPRLADTRLDALAVDQNRQKPCSAVNRGPGMVGTALIYHISRHELRLRDFEDRPAFEPRTILGSRMAYLRRAWIIEYLNQAPVRARPTYRWGETPVGRRITFRMLWLI
ncbi:hypothetical protein N234_35900 [Ralstonia pickettii DTP0602]|nr:hypothetical protein N234_35900 [Ralstonia pickettii DTP0602]